MYITSSTLNLPLSGVWPGASYLSFLNLSSSITKWTTWICQTPLSVRFSRQELVSNHSILQGIFPTQGSNLGLLHFRQIIYRLSHQGSPLNHYPILYLEYSVSGSWETLLERMGNRMRKFGWWRRKPRHKSYKRDIPGCPVVKTLHFHYSGREFDPRLVNWDPTCRAVWPKIN